MMLVLHVLWRELVLSFRHQGNVFYFLAFMLVAVSLFPFAFGISPRILTSLAPGVIWLTTLFACILSLPYLLEKDYEDGVLEQIVLMGFNLPTLMMVKVFVHYLLTGVIVACMVPLFGVLLAIPSALQLGLASSLLVGTPVLSLIGVMAASLVLGARRAARMLPILIFPLYIPVIIFGVAAAQARVPMIALLGFDLLLLPIAILAACGGVRVALSR